MVSSLGPGFLDMMLENSEKEHCSETKKELDSSGGLVLRGPVVDMETGTLKPKQFLGFKIKN